MKTFLTLVILASMGFILAIGINSLFSLSMRYSGLLAAVVMSLVFLMLDLRPAADPEESTIVRLTKGNWYRKK